MNRVLKEWLDETKKVPSLEVDCPKKGLGVNSLKTTVSESVASEQTADIKAHIMGTA